jgi:hypothetical protein
VWCSHSPAQQNFRTDAEVIDDAFFRKYKNMSEPDKKKLRKVLDAWEDE